MPLVDRLEDGKDLTEVERKFQGRGAADTLSYLGDLKKKATRIEVTEGGITIYTLSDTLHVASLDKPHVSSDTFSVNDLEAAVAKLFPSDSEGGRPQLMTSRDKYHFKFSGRGMTVVEPEFLLTGFDEVNEAILEGTDELYVKLQENSGTLPLEQVTEMLGRKLFTHQFVQFAPTDFARVTGEYVRNKSGTRIVGVENPRLVLLDPSEKSKRIKIGNERPVERVLGVQALDMEQYIAMQYGLLNPDVELVFVCGGAGSGKTVLSYATAVDQVLCYPKSVRTNRNGSDERGGQFKQIVLLKPFETMGGARRDVGFLPGSLFDKIKKQLDSYADAHKLTSLVPKGEGTYIPFEAMFLHPRYENDFNKLRPEGINKARINGGYLPPNEVIELTYSGFLRGRSFHDTLVMVDEAQNFTPYEMKTILSRMGPGCKVIVMGDAEDQIDNPLCTPEINGLTHAIRQFKAKDYCGIFQLRHLHRSQMAEDAHHWNSVYR